MKKLLVLIFFFLFGSSSLIHAQPGPGWGSGIPGAQQLITQYGDQLDLTDEQKSELIAQSLKQRRNMQRFRMRGDRPRPGNGQGERRSQKERNREQNERPYIRAQSVYEVLTDEQAETLKSLLIERAEKEHEFRTLRNDILVDQAGIEGEKADQVTAILNRQSESRKDMSVQRIQNPGETDREAMREVFQSMREEHQEIKSILTAAEYEKLQQAISPRHYRHRTAVKRPVLRLFKR